MVIPTNLALTYEPKLREHCCDKEVNSLVLLCLQRGITSTTLPLAGISRAIQWILPSRIYDLDAGA